MGGAGGNTKPFGRLLILTLVFEEIPQGGGGFPGGFLGEEVTAREGAALDVFRILAPDRRDVAVVPADETVLAPEGEQRGDDLLAAGRRGVIVVQVGADGGAVVLAGGVDRGRF